MAPSVSDSDGGVSKTSPFLETFRLPQFEILITSCPVSQN
jgi:hypothetical protein